MAHNATKCLMRNLRLRTNGGSSNEFELLFYDTILMTLATQWSFSGERDRKIQSFVKKESGRFFFSSFPFSNLGRPVILKTSFSYVECHWDNSKPRQFLIIVSRFLLVVSFMCVCMCDKKKMYM